MPKMCPTTNLKVKILNNAERATHHIWSLVDVGSSGLTNDGYENDQSVIRIFVSAVRVCVKQC